MDRSIPVKERVLKTADNLFYKQGYNRTGINQILEESSVAKASLYQHFRSKEALGLAYVENSREAWFSELEEFINDAQKPGQKILACFDYLEKSFYDNEFRGCRFINLMAEIDGSSETMVEQVKEHKAKLKDFFRGLIAEYLGKQIPALELLTNAVFLMFEGVMVESKVNKEAWPIQQGKEAVAGMLKIKD